MTMFGTQFTVRTVLNLRIVEPNLITLGVPQPSLDPVGA